MTIKRDAPSRRPSPPPHAEFGPNWEDALHLTPRELNLDFMSRNDARSIPRKKIFDKNSRIGVKSSSISNHKRISNINDEINEEHDLNFVIDPP